METATIPRRTIEEFAAQLCAQGCAAGTVQAYRRQAAAFAAWLGAAVLDGAAARAWKRRLQQSGLRPATVNAKLAALNRLLRFLGRGDCCQALLRVQRRAFRDPARELTRAEYRRLCAAAARRPRLALALETLCAAGLRASELAFVTVEAARRGRADVALKGKVRTIFLPRSLCRKLLRYAAGRGIAAGPVFRSRSGAPLSRKRIWAEMKSLCPAAQVRPGKVFPHNLRHLFAVSFYAACRDVVRLADVLGHASIETTRIYLCTSGAEHSRQIERLGLVQP